MSAFAEYIRGKRVCIVGPASTLVGTSTGAKIDAYDVVVRLKRALIPRGLKRDYGARTDVLYVTLQRWMYGLSDYREGGTWDKAGVKWVVMARRKGTRHRRMVHLGVPRRFHYRRIPKRTYKAIKRGGGNTLPLAGNVVIGDMLRMPYKTLYICGFTYYQTPHDWHYPGFQPPIVARKWNNEVVMRKMMSPSRNSGSAHYLPPQVRYICRCIRLAPRCQCDPILQGVVSRWGV